MQGKDELDPDVSMYYYLWFVSICKLHVSINSFVSLSSLHVPFHHLLQEKCGGPVIVAQRVVFGI